MSIAGSSRDVSERCSQPEAESPYLPPPRSSLREKLVRLRFQATYWTWKRMMCRYGDGSLQGEEPLRFLDVGCGPGNFICCLENWFLDAKITALDMSQEVLRYAAGRTKRANLLQGSAEGLPFVNKAFHILSGLQVIEHFPNPEEFLSEGHRVLKQNGLLLLATPNPQGLGARLLGKRWGGIRYDHISLRLPAQWHKTLEKSGFDVLDEGTTLFNGIPLIGRFPLGVPFQLLQAISGWFPWFLGESYMAVARKAERTKSNGKHG